MAFRDGVNFCKAFAGALVNMSQIHLCSCKSFAKIVPVPKNYIFPPKGHTISKANHSVLNSSKKNPKENDYPEFLSISKRQNAQDSDFLFVFGKIKNTINCSRDFLTFRYFLPIRDKSA